MYQEINQFYAGQGWEIVSNHHEDILFPIFAILLILSPVSPSLAITWPVTVETEGFHLADQRVNDNA